MAENKSYVGVIVHESPVLRLTTGSRCRYVNNTQFTIRLKFALDNTKAYGGSRFKINFVYTIGSGSSAKTKFQTLIDVRGADALENLVEQTRNEYLELDISDDFSNLNKCWLAVQCNESSCKIARGSNDIKISSSNPGFKIKESVFTPNKDLWEAERVGLTDGSDRFASSMYTFRDEYGKEYRQEFVSSQPKSFYVGWRLDGTTCGSNPEPKYQAVRARYSDQDVWINDYHWINGDYVYDGEDRSSYPVQIGDENTAYNNWDPDNLSGRTRLSVDINPGFEYVVQWMISNYTAGYIGGDTPSKLETLENTWSRIYEFKVRTKYDPSVFVLQAIALVDESIGIDSCAVALNFTIFSPLLDRNGDIIPPEDGGYTLIEALGVDRVDMYLGNTKFTSPSQAVKKYKLFSSNTESGYEDGKQGEIQLNNDVINFLEPNIENVIQFGMRSSINYDYLETPGPLDYKVTTSQTYNGIKIRTSDYCKIEFAGTDEVDTGYFIHGIGFMIGLSFLNVGSAVVNKIKVSLKIVFINEALDLSYALDDIDVPASSLLPTKENYHVVSLSLNESTWDEIYKLYSNTDTDELGVSITVTTISETGKTYEDSVYIRSFLTGNQKTAHIGIGSGQNNVHRCQVWVGKNGTPKKCVTWVGTKTSQRRTI